MSVKEKKQNIFITSKSECIENPHIVELLLSRNMHATL